MSVHREQIIQAALQGVEIGCPVHTSDGVEIGLVKEISGDFVKIDAPLRADYWISADYVLNARAEGVELSFAKSDLAAYRRAKPDVLEGEDPLSSEATVDAVMNEDEQMEQRVRMERELVEQRRDLPHTHPEGEDAPPDTGGTRGEPVEQELERLAADDPSIHTDDAGDTPPDFMTKTDARAIVGLESDSPLVPPVESVAPAAYGEPPAVLGVAANNSGVGPVRSRESDTQGAAEGARVASAVTGVHRSAEMERIEADSAGYEPAAATPASPATAPPIERWSDYQPSGYADDDAPSMRQRAWMTGAGLAILLGAGYVVRRITHRR